MYHYAMFDLLKLEIIFSSSIENWTVSYGMQGRVFIAYTRTQLDELV